MSIGSGISVKICRLYLKRESFVPFDAENFQLEAYFRAMRDATIRQLDVNYKVNGIFLTFLKTK